MNIFTGMKTIKTNMEIKDKTLFFIEKELKTASIIMDLW